MLRFHPIANAAAAIAYFSKSDGYYTADELRQEWLGKGADKLGLSGSPDFEHFKQLIHGLNPHTGKQLTAKLIENRVPAWDVTASIPKGVTIAIERGDPRVREALWEAARETVADLERHATTRVRKGGVQEDRLTDNLIVFAVEHPETRPSKKDNMPDFDRHIHLVLMNLTHDEKEGEWKAVKFRPVMDLRKYFDRRFDQRLASKLADLGYSIETKYRADPRGGKRYFSWDIKDMPESLVKKFSRRAGEVEKLAEDLGVVSPQGKDKLGATSRRFKRKDMTLADYRAYWDSRVTPEEARQVAEVIKAAMLGQNHKPENTADKAVRYAIEHEFERRSVVDWHDLAITAMERSMGGAKPEEIEPEAIRQGVLLRDGEATTKEVLAEEARIIQFAREGRGTCSPMGIGAASGYRAQYLGLEDRNVSINTYAATGAAKIPFPLESHASARGRQQPHRPDPATTSPEQQAVSALSPDQLAVVRHIWNSDDRVILVEGDAGTGKTQTMQRTIPGIDRHGVFLAPSASASRGTLREKGFTNADTIARFLVDPKFREQARGGYIYIDEAPLAGLKDIDGIVAHARELDARIIFQGDRKQHRSVQRGNLFHILESYASLPVGRLTRNWRQQGKDYREAVNVIAKGDLTGGLDRLDALGWVRQTPEDDHNKMLVDDYVASRSSTLIVAPTHREGDEITAAIRERLKSEGMLGEEREFDQLVPLSLTNAQKGDLGQYDGTEVLQYYRNSGSFRAGQQVRVADLKPGDRMGSPKQFAVYRPAKVRLAVGDTARTTANVKDIYGKRIDNDTALTVTGFTDNGDIEARTTNGVTKVLPRTSRHLAHGYVTTSYASQGKTVDRVLIAMGSESVPAINAEQFYVSVSRGREQATIYSDLSPDQLREAIQKRDARKSATELMGPRPKPKRRGLIHSLMRKAQDRFRKLREHVAGGNREITKQQEREYAGYGR